MKNVRWMVLASLIGVSTSVALAQPGPGKGMGPMGAGSAASAPGMGLGMGSGMGPGGGGRGAMRPDSGNTPGWALMTQQERTEHRDRMRSMKTYDECKTYQDQHHDQMVARAKDRGGKALTKPRRDGCAGLKK